MKWIRWMIVFEVVLIVLLGPLVLCDPEHRSAAQARVDAPGRLIRLSAGVTHFELSEPAARALNENLPSDPAPLVVLVPGLATPYFVWDPTREALLAAGYPVLRYDLYGRGYSDRPEGAVHDVNLYDRQLLELLDALGVSRPVHIVGLSMGGVISIHFADRHPKRVRSLSLFAPAGFPMEIPFIARFARLPGIGDYFIHAFGHGQFMSRLGRNMYDQSLLSEYKKEFLPQMKVAGTKAALLSSLRRMPLGESRPVYERVATRDESDRIPMQVLWGVEDRVIPFSVGEAMRAALPDVPFHAVENAGHLLHWERPEAVRSKLMKFLKDH
ncbi:MAG: alpha/beta fold hydrolase [Leptospirales bacterium]|jgi:pimeloyl-ACP methyl ester carboxylesterase